MRKFALYGVAGIETSEAIASFERPLVREDPDVISFAVSKLEVAGRRLTPFRRKYLDLLVQALGSRDPDCGLYPELLDAFSELAGERFGDNGRSFPHGLDESAARATAARCLAWYRRNRPDPQDSHRWYNEPVLPVIS